jgi:hypothetical protein
MFRGELDAVFKRSPKIILLTQWQNGRVAICRSKTTIGATDRLGRSTVEEIAHSPTLDFKYFLT